MQRLSARSIKNKGVPEPVNRQQWREKNYKLFAINYYGNGLNSIRDEFYQQVQTGLRRRVIIIDLDEEMRRASAPPVQVRSSKLLKDSKQQKAPFAGLLDMLSLTIVAIEKCRREYDEITAIIAKELSFDLLRYWQNELDSQTSSDKWNKRKSSLSKSGLEKIPEKPKRRSSNKTMPALQEDQADLIKLCTTLAPKLHNRTGRPELLYKRKYIEDEPLTGKLYIILMGSKMNNQFYLDLLSRGEPLQAIIHFLPEPCGYDYLMPHADTQAFVIRTVENIQSETYKLRQQPLTKPVGIFQQGLPVISRCLAQKYAREIYDQMCWCEYDVETLLQQYQQYYVQPFQETDVGMPASVNVRTLLDIAESLSVQGHYMTAPLPACSSDTATILLYMESLLSSIGAPLDLSFRIVADPAAHFRGSKERGAVRNLTANFSLAFNSILKLGKVSRLYVEQNNSLLCELISFARNREFSNMHSCCLEYRLLRKYFQTAHPKDAVKCQLYDSNSEPIYLPGVVKFYASGDSVLQRLAELLLEYDDCQLDELQPGYRLYHFKRVYNEVFENTKMMIIPTRLCFRDFTLFQKQEFLGALITPEMRVNMLAANLTSEQRKLMEFQQKEGLIDAQLFIRLNSLKARRLKPDVRASATSNRGAPVGNKAQARSSSSANKEVAAQNSSDDYIGLPAQHALLKGYNLEDIRQEIVVQTCKYFIEEGALAYYEERWCFDDMNKCLELSLHGSKLSLCCPRHKVSSICRSVRLQTKNDVSIRIFGAANECAKVLLHYPNGLSVYHHEEYAEQSWQLPETYNHEQRRVYTQFGAVIVHFKEQDMILIMRYNGEVYRLYQFELPLDEEEEAEQTGSTQADDSFDDTSKTITPTTDSKSKGPSPKDTSRSTARSKLHRSSADSKSDKKSETDKKQRRNSAQSSKPSSKESSNISLALNKPSSKYIKQTILESIADELQFLEFICIKYDVSYLHMMLTTSMGRLINIIKRGGKVYELPALWNVEWHDYFADESYAMRGDGVKMIWTATALKCYHADGTVLTTKMAEACEKADFDDEFGSLISQSSSHEQSNLTSDSLQKLEQDSIFIMLEDTQPKTKHSTLKPQASIKYFNTEAGVEAEAEEDRSYVSYFSESVLMQHKHYAAVHILLYRNYMNELKVSLEIFAADDTRIQMTTQDIYESELLNTMNLTASAPKAAMGVEMPENNLSNTVKPLINVWIGDNLNLCVSDKDCVINAILERNDDVEVAVRENLSLSFDFEANLSSLFHELVSQIAEFKNYKGAKRYDLYFMEKVDNICRTQGFEFYDDLPTLEGYTYAASNTVTELRKMENVDEKFANDYEWFQRDMKKFPRFQKRVDNKSSENVDDFPHVMSSSIYCKVPRLLVNTEDIHKFMEPFEGITFKETRKKIFEATDFHLRPRILPKLQQWASKISWRRHQEEHIQRVFKEQQRSGLYHAMLKHHVYPKYHQFVHDFHGQVKYIDFFAFMVQKCQTKPEVFTSTTEKTRNTKTSIATARKISINMPPVSLEDTTSVSP